jgi:outer membrane immunogenic protein
MWAAISGQPSAAGCWPSAHIGVNGQFDRVVVGVEADVAATSNGNNGFGQKFRQGTNGSMRGRLGYSFDRMMVYGTGGVAVSNYQFKNAVGKDSSMQTGAVFGAGAEVMLTQNVSVRGELLRYQFSSRSYGSIGGPTSVAPTNNVLRGGMSYKF